MYLFTSARVNEKRVKCFLSLSNPQEAGDSTSATKWSSGYPPETLIKVLINLPDLGRQILSQIVERRGSLSDELKKAVLRVVG